MSLRVCYQIRECLPVTGTVYYLVNHFTNHSELNIQVTFPSITLNPHEMPTGVSFHSNDHFREQETEIQRT